MTDCNGFVPTEKMLDPTALAEMLRISLRHLADVRRDDPTFPVPKMLGNLPRWSPATIRRWMELCSTTWPEAPTFATPNTNTSATATAKGQKKRKAVQRVH